MNFYLQRQHPLTPSILFSWAKKAATFALCAAATLHAVAAGTASPDAHAGSGNPKAAAVVLPPSAKLEFEVKGKVSGINYGADAQLQWAADAENYRAFQSIRIPLIGTRSQESTGVVTPAGLHPQRFEDSRRNRVLQFQPTESTVTYFQATESTPIPVNSQDRLSVFFQLASIVAANPAQFTKGKTVEIPTVTFNKQDFWTFEAQAAESLEVPAGTLPSIKLRRLPRKENDQIAEIWLSPDTQYLPVRIYVQEDDGDAVDLRLKKFTPATPAPNR